MFFVLSGSLVVADRKLKTVNSEIPSEAEAHGCMVNHCAKFVLKSA
jgi:hypothetical protein